MTDKKKSFYNKKVIAILLAAFMLISILFSYHFIIENAHHDCTGEKCSICLQLEEAAQFISSIKFVSILSFTMAVLCIFTKWVAHETKDICVNNTLVSLKVKLLD